MVLILTMFCELIVPKDEVVIRIGQSGCFNHPQYSLDVAMRREEIQLHEASAQCLCTVLLPWVLWLSGKSI